MRAVIVSSAGSADRPSPAHQQQLFSIGQSCSCLASKQKTKKIDLQPTEAKGYFIYTVS